MLASDAARIDSRPVHYERRRPEQTVLYQTVYLRWFETARSDAIPSIVCAVRRGGKLVVLGGAQPHDVKHREDVHRTRALDVPPIAGRPGAHGHARPERGINRRYHRVMSSESAASIHHGSHRTAFEEAVLEAPQSFGESPPAKLGRYAILGTLGQGGMGTVLDAFDPQLDRRVAIKLLHPQLGQQHTARLMREAQAMAKLSHPNVVQVYEVGELDGRSFVAMELVRGRTLRDWMRQQPPPTWKQCIEVFVEVGRGLAAAHAQGLVHRDFKPGNAIVDQQGRPRVLDFGLARRGEVEGRAGYEDADAGTSPTSDRTQRDVDRRDGTWPVGDADAPERGAASSDASALDLALTATGAVLGTPAYMPLEQMLGRGVDARSDQFSFCVSLWEAVYGERPFEGSSLAALMLSMRSGFVRDAPEGSTVPPALRRIMQRGLATNPDERWPSMDALLVELQRLVAMRTRRWVAITGVSLSVLVAGVVQYRATRSTEEAAAALAKAESAATQAQVAAEQEKAEAQMQRGRARDSKLMTYARAMVEQDPTRAILALGSIQATDSTEWRQTLMDALERPIARVVLSGHDQLVFGASFSADGRYVVTASMDGTARIWNADGSGVATVLRHPGPVAMAAFDPGGRRVLTVGMDQEVRAWTLAAPDAPVVLDGQVRDAKGIDVPTFSPDGRTIVGICSDGAARVWHADGSGSAVILRAAEGPLSSAGFSPDGLHIVTGAVDGTVRTWGLDGNEAAVLMASAGSRVVGVRHGADGQRVLIALEDGTVRAWSEEDGIALVLSHGGSVLAPTAFGTHGRRIVTVEDSTVRVWSTDDGSSMNLEGAADVVLSTSLDSEEEHVLMVGADGIVRVWSVEGPGAPLMLRGHEGAVIRTARFSPDGQSIVTASQDGTARIWSTDGGDVPITVGRTSATATVLLTPEGHRMTINTGGYTDVSGVDGDGQPIELDEHWWGLVHASLGPGGRRLVTASADHTARVWTLDGSVAPIVLRGHEDMVLRARFSSDGERVATVSGDETVRIWRADGSGAAVVLRPESSSDRTTPTDSNHHARPSSDDRHVALIMAAVTDYDVRFSPDARHVAAIMASNTAWVWAADGSGEPVGLSHTLPTTVRSVSFSPDGRRVLTAIVDEARLWDAAGGGSPVTLDDHGGGVWSAEPSPDGRYIVTTSGDHKVLVWSPDGTKPPVILDASRSEMPQQWEDASGRRFISRLRGSVSTASFSPDGRRITAIWEDGTSRTWSAWPFDPAVANERIEASTKACIPLEDRIEYLGEAREDACRAFATCEHRHWRPGLCPEAAPNGARSRADHGPRYGPEQTPGSSGE